MSSRRHALRVPMIRHGFDFVTNTEFNTNNIVEKRICAIIGRLKP